MKHLILRKQQYLVGLCSENLIGLIILRSNLKKIKEKRKRMNNETHVDMECINCKRFKSGSCAGVEDRKRDIITIKNQCSGFLKMEDE